MPADGKGAKGGDVMTKTHATGSAMTYGQRYLVKMIFNIAVGADDDGRAAGAQPTIASRGETIEGEPLVIDGDTIQMNGVRIRLFGIDAPESG